MRIDHLYRYPVKGLTAEALEEITLEEGQILPWDRAFALAQGDAPFDPKKPSWIRKSNFLCLAAHPRAALLRSAFDPHNGVLLIRFPDGSSVAENPLHPDGQARLAEALTRFMGSEARGTPRFIHAPGFNFIDDAAKVISLINLASIHDLERSAGAERHHLRFRANIYFSGTPAWSEFDWLGRDIQIGGARLRLTRRIVRCAATEVNHETAERDAETVRELRQGFGHADMGIYGEVIEPGRIAVGDALELLP